jgi:hypothetical protein
MPSQDGYSRWPSDAKIPLVLSLADSNGLAVRGAHPEVSIRRYRETHGNALDNHYWAGLDTFAFTPTPTWLPMVEIDSVNSPGLYAYIFKQDFVGLEWVYHVYYRNLTDPIGFFVEEHLITNEVYIPETQPDPIILGSESVMGQLEIVKGLLQHNSMVDRQTYADGMLTSARVRVFDVPDHIPPTPGGNETAGRIAEFQISSSYDADGLNQKFTLKRVYP